MHIHFVAALRLASLLLGVLLLAACETLDTGADPLNFVPVDDLGDLSYDQPVAVEADEMAWAEPDPTPEPPKSRRTQAPSAQAPTQAPTRTGRETPRRVEDSDAMRSTPAREMQRPTFAGLSTSAPVAFEEPSKRFVRDGSDGSGQPVAVDTGPVLEPRVIPAARVVHANAGDGYVIVLCEKLPKPGEDAQIFRDDELVGEVRFVSNRKGRYIVADIVSGEPKRGDVARYACLFPQKEEAPKEEKKTAEPAKEPEKKRGRGLPLFF